MGISLYLSQDGSVKDSLTNLSVGCWHSSGGYIQLYIPHEPEEIYHSKPATHRGVRAECDNPKRNSEVCEFDPATKTFRVVVTEKDRQQVVTTEYDRRIKAVG